MARYPTYDEYKDKPKKGIQRCDELLKKSPWDSQLLIAKLQLLVAVPDAENAKKVLNELLASDPAVRSPSEISSIEEVVIELDSQTYPPPLTAGPEVSQLWDNATKAAPSIKYKFDLQSLRFSRAVVDNRLVDAQQALIQLKNLSPKDRTFYMAHAAITQMLSTSKDDLQSRLALMLARKAVKENYDQDKELDCRVVGQIFASQASANDIESVIGRSFADSKQIYDATRDRDRQNIAQETTPTSNTEPADLPPKQWLAVETDLLKTQYHRLLESGPTSDALQTFAANAITLYITATSSLALASFRPSADAILLAVSALVKKSSQEDWSCASLLRAAFIAESLLRNNPHIHEAKVILIYLYMRLSLGSLALKHWESLSVKEVQYDTVGHVFLTRLSITHPHSFKSRSKELEPLRIVTHGLEVYRRCEKKLAETHASVLSHGQTGMIFDLYELRESLRLSLTRRILALEQRRYARLFGKKLDEKNTHPLPRLTASWLDIKDNRDFSAVLKHGGGVDLERALHRHADAEAWILFNLAADSLWCTCHNHLPAVKDTSELLKALDQISSQGSGTDQEYLVGHLIRQLLRLLVGTGDTKVSAVEAAVTALSIDVLVEEWAPFPLRVQDVYLYIDALRLLTSACKYADQKKILTNEAAKGLRTTGENAFAKIQAYAKQRSTSLGQMQVQDYTLAYGGDVSESLKALGEQDLRSFCASVADSSKDAWSGVAQFKLT